MHIYSDLIISYLYTKNIIETSEKVWWKFWDGATFDKNVAESDKKIIVDYYKENGFKDAEVSGLDYKLSTDKKDVIVTFKINEGMKERKGVEKEKTPL